MAQHGQAWQVSQADGACQHAAANQGTAGVASGWGGDSQLLLGGDKVHARALPAVEPRLDCGGRECRANQAVSRMQQEAWCWNLVRHSLMAHTVESTASDLYMYTAARRLSGARESAWQHACQAQAEREDRDQ